jgi:hypothetical protein
MRPGGRPSQRAVRPGRQSLTGLVALALAAAVVGPGTGWGAPAPEAGGPGGLAAGHEWSAYLPRIERASPPTLELAFNVGGHLSALAVDGRRAFLGIGLRVAVLDLSLPASPRLLGETPPFGERVTDLAVAGDLVVATTGHGEYGESGPGALRLVDVSDAARPLALGVVPTAAAALGVALAEDHALVAAGRQGTLIVDVRDPARPRVVATLPGPGRTTDVAVAGALGYAVGDEGLQVLDLTVPGAARILGAAAIDEDLRFVSAQDGLAIVAADRGLTVVDVSNPPSPRAIGAWQSAQTVHGLTRSGYGLYVLTWYGITLIDLADPTQPQARAEIERVRPSPTSLAVAGGSLLIGFEDGHFELSDLADPTAPRLLGTWQDQFGGPLRRLYAEGDRLYVERLGESQAGRIDILDAGDPAGPRLLGTMPLVEGSARPLSVLRRHLYLTGSGLRIVDASQPAALREVGSLRAAWLANDIAVGGGYALILDSHGRVHVIDLGDLASPREIGAWSLGDRDTSRLALAPDGGSLYALANRVIRQPDGGQVVLASLRVLDLNGPLAPTLQAALDLPDQAWTVRMAADSGRLFVGFRRGLMRLDLRGADGPQSTGEWSGRTEDLVLLPDGWHLAVVGQGQLRVVDVMDPLTLRTTSRHSLAEDYTLLAVAGGRLWTGTWESGLVGYRLR